MRPSPTRASSWSLVGLVTFGLLFTSAVAAIPAAAASSAPTLAASGTVPLGPPGAYPSTVAADPLTGQVFVGLPPSYVDVVDPQNASVVRSIDLGAGNDPAAMTVNAESGELYVVTTNERVLGVSVANGTVLWTVTGTGAGPDGIAYDANEANLYITNYQSNEVWIVAAYGQTIGYLTAYSPQAVAYNPISRQVDIVGITEGGGATYVKAYAYGSPEWVWESSAAGSSNGAGIGVDPETGDIFATSDATDQLLALTPTGAALGTTSLTSSPTQLAYGAATVGIVAPGSDLVSFVNATTLALDSTQGVQGFPQEIAYDPVTEQFAVASYLSNTLSLLPAEGAGISATVLLSRAPVALTDESPSATVAVVGADTVASLINGSGPAVGFQPVGRNPVGIASVPSLNELFVTNGYDDTVSILSSTTLASVGTIGVCEQPGGDAIDGDPSGIVYDAPLNELYVACQYNAFIDAIQPSTGHINAVIPVGTGPVALAVDPATGDVLVVATDSGSVQLVHGLGVIASDNLNANPTAATYDPTTGTFLVSATSVTGGSLDVIVAATFQWINAFVTAPGAAAVAYVPSWNYALVTIGNANQTWVLNATTGRLLALVDVGYAPGAIDYDSANQMVYVANTESDSVSMIDPHAVASALAPASNLGLFGLPGATGYYLIAAAALGVVAVSTVAVVRWRHAHPRPKRVRPKRPPPPNPFD